MVQGTELARFTYDGLGRRAQKIAGGVTWTYIYDEEDILEERLSTGPVYRYVHGPGIDEPLARTEGGSVVAYYLADHLGSVVQETNVAGAVSLAREYDPYGSVLQGSSSSGYAFTGREWDAEIGAHYYRARFYQGTLGRFISEDPSPDAVFLPEGPNLYGYAGNDPTNKLDPFGLGACGSGTNEPYIPDSGPCFNFTDPCRIHDACYDICGKTKGECDQQFLNNMRKHCSKRRSFVGSSA